MRASRVSISPQGGLYACPAPGFQPGAWFSAWWRVLSGSQFYVLCPVFAVATRGQCYIFGTGGSPAGMSISMCFQSCCLLGRASIWPESRLKSSLLEHQRMFTWLSTTEPHSKLNRLLGQLQRYKRQPVNKAEGDDLSPP